jgi:hypothetical protein
VTALSPHACNHPIIMSAPGGQTGSESTGAWLAKPGVSVEKVAQLMLVGVRGSGYKQARVLDAAVDD